MNGFYMMGTLVVKRLIFGTQNIVHELPHEFANDLRLKFLKIRKYLKNLKVRWRQSLVSSFLSKNKSLVIELQNSQKQI